MDSLSVNPDPNSNDAENDSLSTSVDLLHPGGQANEQPAQPVQPAPTTPPYVSPASNTPSSPAQKPNPASYIPTSVAGNVPRPASNQRMPFILAGIVLLVLALGGGGYYYFVSRQAAQVPQVEEPTVITVSTAEPQTLAQQDANGTDNLAPETAINESSLAFSFKLPGVTGDEPVTPEIEIVALGTEFTDEPTAKGEPFTGDTASVTVADLADGSYRWQARISRDTEVGPWAAYGTDTEKADFIIDTKAPVEPVVKSVEGKAVGSGKVATTSNRPKFEGTAEAGANISMQAGTISFNATADDKGNWAIEPTANIATGDITVKLTATDPAGNASKETSLALAINTATTGDQAANNTDTTTNTGTTTGTTTTQPAPTTQDDTLAATGDNTALANLVAFALLFLASAGFLAAKRDENS